MIAVTSIEVTVSRPKVKERESVKEGVRTTETGILTT